jgi:hypothetical protein
LRADAVIGSVLAALFPCSVQCQITAAEANSIRSAIGNRVEALTILGCDFGLAGGTYRFTGDNDGEVNVSKFGGDGDVGDPRKLGKLGNLDTAWQPRLQGSIGYVDATSHLHSGPLNGGTNEFEAFAIQFGADLSFRF